MELENRGDVKWYEDADKEGRGQGNQAVAATGLSRKMASASVLPFSTSST